MALEGPAEGLHRQSEGADSFRKVVFRLCDFATFFRPAPPLRPFGDLQFGKTAALHLKWQSRWSPPGNRKHPVTPADGLCQKPMVCIWFSFFFPFFVFFSFDCFLLLVLFFVFSSFFFLVRGFLHVPVRSLAQSAKPSRSLEKKLAPPTFSLAQQRLKRPC